MGEGDLGHSMSSWPWKGWETRWSHLDGRPYLCGHQGLSELPRWAGLWVCCQHCHRRMNCCPQDSTGSSCLGPPGLCPHAFPFADISLDPFAIINGNHDITTLLSFVSPSIFYHSTGPEGGVGAPWTAVTCSKNCLSSWLPFPTRLPVLPGIPFLRACLHPSHCFRIRFGRHPD